MNQNKVKFIGIIFLIIGIFIVSFSAPISNLISPQHSIIPERGAWCTTQTSLQNNSIPNQDIIMAIGCTISMIGIALLYYGQFISLNDPASCNKCCPMCGRKKE
jgi:hypothetical protein